MASQFNDSFNVAADKVVSFKEFQKRSKALYKAELSIGDKLFKNIVDLPMSVVGMTAVTAKMIFNTKGQSDKIGLYENKDNGQLYVSGAYLQQSIDGMKDLFKRFTWNKKYQEKIDGLQKKAFEQSKDVSAKPVMKRLKPL